MKPFVAPMSCGLRAVTLLVGLALCAGCTTTAIRTQSPEDQLVVETQTRMVGDTASPYGMNYVKVEQVGLVAGLMGTGSDPAPSELRAALISEMQARGVENPSKVISTDRTSLVLVRAFIPPGAQKGDRVDVEVRLPARSETKSLLGGRLLQARLTEIATIGGQIHSGHIWALAEGPLLIEPTSEGESNAGEKTHAKILSGGVVTKDRTLGLTIHTDQKSTRLSAQIGAALNRRFHTYSQGLKQGIAVPKTDEYIELAILPRYKNNLARYMRVVRSVAIQETEQQTLQRLKVLEQQLLDSVTSGTAALRLEAIGNDGIKVLKKGLESNDPEVRFYSAEALAYLDVPDAAKTLGEIARQEPTYRAFALAALSVMDDVAASEVLRELLDLPSVETRYGAFRSLWTMNDKDPLVKGEKLGGQFSYHLINTTAQPMIHVTKSFRPELVLFGPEQRFLTPFALEAGTKIVVKSLDNRTVSVSSFSTSEADQKRVVTTKVDDVVRAVVELGGTYPDVVQLLLQAKGAGALEGRFEVESLPDRARYYEHLIEDQEEKGTGDGSGIVAPPGEKFSGGPDKKKSADKGKTKAG